MIVVQIVRTEGEAPREIQLDPARERDQSLIESLRRKVQREELHSVTVVTEEAPPPAKATARKSSSSE